MNQEIKILIGPHIAKCAGISFTEAIRSQLGAKHCICDSYLKRFHLEDERFPEERENLDHIRVIFGHAVDQFTIKHALKLGKEIILFTFIRHPIDRIISFYAFTCRHRQERNLPPVDFNSFYNEIQHNSMCTWLTQRFQHATGPLKNSLSTQAASVLKTFKFVCSTEDLADRGEDLYKMIGIKHDPCKRSNFSPKSQIDEIRKSLNLKKLYADNSEDLDLYNQYIKGKSSNEHNPFGYDHNHFKKFLELLCKDKTPLHDVWRSRYKGLTDNLLLNKLIDPAQKSAQNRLQQAQILLEVLNSKKHSPLSFEIKQYLPQDECRNDA